MNYISPSGRILLNKDNIWDLNNAKKIQKIPNLGDYDDKNFKISYDIKTMLFTNY
jgi:hypothetical protein